MVKYGVGGPLHDHDTQEQLIRKNRRNSEPSARLAFGDPVGGTFSGFSRVGGEGDVIPYFVSMGTGNFN